LAGSDSGVYVAFPLSNRSYRHLVVVNAKVLTVDPNNTQAEAVAIRGNTFAAVGTTAAIRKMAGPETRVIDAGGRTVVPGFIESHVHATGAARGEVSQAFVQLIHAYFASADTARRAASLGAVVDTQPMWFYKDGDALLKALGPKYMNT
jgi:predicted amidohydrolase YtcJ